MLPRVSGGILCAGNLVFDILVRPVDQVVWDTTTWVESLQQHLGGNGASTSYGLALLDTPVRLLGMVGSDVFGDSVLGHLRRAGVDLTFVAHSQQPTATTVGLVNAHGARAFVHYPGASAEVFPAPIDFTAGVIEGRGHFHLANVFALPQMRRHAGETLRRARLAGLTTSLDTGWDARGEWLKVLAPCLPHVDFLFANHDEAHRLTGKEDPRHAARFFENSGVQVVVLKLGGKGCAVFNEEHETHSPAFDVPVVDTTGAGDCFVAGFLAALQHGASLTEAARLANAVGALSVQTLWAVEGLLSYRETLAWMKTTPVRA